MRVLMLPGDKGGCGLYRMVMPGRSVAKAYPGDEVFAADGINGRASRDRWGRVTVHTIPPIDADVVVFQRPLNDDLAACIPLVQAQGVAVVVEFDDDFRNADPRNVAASKVHPATSPASNYEILERAASLADMVTVSTPSLLRYARHGRAKVVRNYVPESLLTVPHAEGKPLRVGWTGTIATHPDDLTVTRLNVASALEYTGAHMAVVGDGQGVFEQLGMSHEPVCISGWVDMQKYPETIAANIDIGIVPLAKTLFNEAKSYLKGLEFAAIGIPFIATPTQEYRILADAGAGLLAHKTRDWHKLLHSLISNDDFRAEESARGKQVVQDHFTIEQHVHEWHDAWEQAMVNRAMARRTHASVG